MTSEPNLDEDTPEDIVRFVPEKGKFRSPRLFIPPDHGRLSVCIALDRSPNDLFEIGLRHVSSRCCGFARTPARIYEVNLKLPVVRDDQGYPGHANVQMPSMENGDDEESKKKEEELIRHAAIAEIERLAPSPAGDGPNAEYPRAVPNTTPASVMPPSDYDVPILREREILRLMHFLRVLVANGS